MKNFLSLLILVIIYSSCEKKNNLTFKSLNPAFEEYIPDDPIYENKKCRIDYFIVDGFISKNKIFDIKIDSVVTELGKKYKDKYPIYSIYFYKLGGDISYEKKYNLRNLKEYLGKEQCINSVVFKYGKLYYFVYIDNEMILYDYINKRVMNEIFE